jgi:hypothetical protein
VLAVVVAVPPAVPVLLLLSIVLLVGAVGVLLTLVLLLLLVPLAMLFELTLLAAPLLVLLPVGRITQRRNDTAVQLSATELSNAIAHNAVLSS